MSDEASQARQLLSSLRDRPVSVDPERLAARRERVLSSIKLEVSALAPRRAKRSRRRAAFVGVMFVAAASSAFAARALLERRPAPAPAPAASSAVTSAAHAAANGTRTPLHENALAPAPNPEPADSESPESSHTPPKAIPHAPDHGTLGAETSLLQRALAAERRGNREQTQALLNQLLSKYPSSPLAPEARRALTRVSGSAVEK